MNADPDRAPPSAPREPAHRVAVLTAGQVDQAPVAAMLARAFHDDPVMAWIFPDPAERARRLPRLFRLLFATDGPAGMRLVTPGFEAATLWRAPGRVQTGTWEMLRHAVPMLHALGGNVARALRVSDAVGVHMPTGDYWYLHIAGCDPAHQGKGLGGAAIAGGLSRVGGAWPVYLETQTASNVGLYQRYGFAVTAEWDVPKGGPHFWSMLRPAGGR